MNRPTAGISKSKRNTTTLSPISNILSNNPHHTTSTTNLSPTNSPKTHFISIPNSSQIIWRRINTPCGGNIFKESAPKDYRKSKTISTEDMIRVLHLSQLHAAKVLNCSLSTLKRRFYELKNELGLKCWPQYFREVRHLPIFKQMYPMSLSFILNDNVEY